MNVWHKPMNVIPTPFVQILLALMDARVKKDLKWMTREFVKVSKDFHYGSFVSSNLLHMAWKGFGS